MVKGMTPQPSPFHRNGSSRLTRIFHEAMKYAPFGADFVGVRRDSVALPKADGNFFILPLLFMKFSG
jgi:hypothetical protein